MEDSNTKIDICILGVHTISDAYPNTKYRLQAMLSNHHNFNVKTIHLGPKIFSPNKKLTLTNAPKQFYLHLMALIQYAITPRRPITFIPYPSIFLAYTLSILPKWFLRSHIVIDCFISPYDTVINDRKLLKRKSFLAKLLKHIEKRAYKTASCIIVDTKENELFYSSIFDLPQGNFTSLPLATAEVEIPKRSRAETNDEIIVLFIGTLIPLHGADKIIEAAKILRPFSNISFKIIGDGQEYELIENENRDKNSNITWRREWIDTQSMFQEIANSDICLGIFGDTIKADRVLPYKVYNYCLAAKPIITMNSKTSTRLKNKAQNEPWISPKKNTAECLASSILKLSQSKEERLKLGENAKAFYDIFLSNKASEMQLIETLRKL